MESSAQSKSTALALQVRALTASVEELMRQNREMRQRLQQEENRSPRRIKNNRNDDEVQDPKGSQGKDGLRRTERSNEASNDLLRSMRKEMDELKNAMKGKMAKNLDGMVRRTDSLFMQKVLECTLPPKFRLPQLESYDGLKDPLDHITTFKMTLSLQQTLDEIVCRSFPTTFKRATRVWFSKLGNLPSTILTSSTHCLCVIS